MPILPLRPLWRASSTTGGTDVGLNLRRMPGALPKLVGHRGACDLAPENTMASFARALADGADIVELDVRSCADGTVVVLHDARVDRTTDGTGLAAEMTLQQLKRLDAGAWFAPSAAGERIPMLAEVLDWACGKIGLLLELKYAAYGAYSPDLVPRVLDLIRRHRVEDQVAFISYQPRGLTQLKALDPQYAAGPLVPAAGFLAFTVALARRFPVLTSLRQIQRVLQRPLTYTQLWGCDVVAPNFAVVTAPLIEKSHTSGLPLSCGGKAWDYPAAIAMGIDTVSSNDPGLVRRLYLS